MNNPTNYHAALYCRLSKDDDQSGESVSIGTQRAVLEDYCREQGIRSTRSMSMMAIPGQISTVRGFRSYWTIWSEVRSIWSLRRICLA